MTIVTGIGIYWLHGANETLHWAIDVEKNDQCHIDEDSTIE